MAFQKFQVSIFELMFRDDISNKNFKKNQKISENFQKKKLKKKVFMKFPPLIL